MVKNRRAPKGNKSIIDVYANKYRRDILEFCKDEPKKIVDIERALKIKHTPLHYHINFLKKMGFVKTELKRERGNPVYVSVVKDAHKNLLGREGERISKEIESLVREILDYVLSLNTQQPQRYTCQEWVIYSVFQDKGYSYFDIMKAINYIKINELMGLIVTDKGREMLNKA